MKRIEIPTEFDVFGVQIINQFRGEHFFLSNFYVRKLTMYGIDFHSSEQAYMWHKTVIEAEKDAILACTTPNAAKDQGRPGKTTLQPDWETILKIPSMRWVLRAKYEQNPDLIQRLLQTKTAMLIEGNWWHDNFWGNCYCGAEKCKAPGLNHLGKLHEFFRDEFAAA